MSKKTKQVGIAEVIWARRMNVHTREGYVSLFLRIVGLGLAAYIIFTQVFLITQNHGLGMFPAMKDGDLIIAFRLQREYAKDDVVVYEMDGKQEVGRIVADVNDVINMDDSGTVTVNGAIQSGEIMYPTYASGSLEYPYSVMPEEYFILGDYRTHTTDSRDYGAIPASNIQGKVITILRRRGL